MFAIERTVQIVGGKILNYVDCLDRKKIFGTLNFDTRKLEPGEIFVAIEGEARDGHEFIKEAIGKKISAALVTERGWAKVPNTVKKTAIESAWIIQCDDTVRAMALLANEWRKQFPIPIFAVTGSNGKTTTKDILGFILNKVAKSQNSYLFSQGSFNNQIGVPRTLSFLNSSHEGAVLEVGTNHFGELAELAKIAEPGGALITNIGDSHLEFLHDRRGVLKAKWELIEGLSGKQKTWFVNRDDPILKRAEAETHPGLKKVSYSRRDSHADYYVAVTDKLGPAGNFGYRIRFSGGKISEEIETELYLPGLHNVQNVLAAFAVAVDFFHKEPAALAEAIKEFQPLSKYRSEIITIEDHFYLFNDCYNANPSSVEAALKMIADASEKRFMVAIGELYEVGGRAEEVHFQIGEAIAKSGANAIGASGSHAEDIIRGAMSAGIKADSVLAVDKPEKLEKFFKSRFQQNNFLLVKGSRGAQMEGLVESLKNIK